MFCNCKHGCVNNRVFFLLETKEGGKEKPPVMLVLQEVFLWMDFCGKRV